jgi:hypothetical protein
MLRLRSAARIIGCLDLRAVRQPKPAGSGDPGTQVAIDQLDAAMDHNLSDLAPTLSASFVMC